ncbi:MAG: hypothetical protein ACO1N9_06855 [Flavobacterium sp.]
MKIRLSYIILGLTLLFAVEGFSQVDRRVGSSQYKRTTKKNTKKADFVEDSVNYLSEKIGLDDFQKAAIRDIIALKKDEAEALAEDKRMKLVEKREKARVIALYVYKEAMPLLSKEQGEKYTKIIEEQYGLQN